MRAVVVYESMYGNTHQIAAAIGEGLRTVVDTDVLSLHDASPERVRGTDLLVVGGPTHTHGMSHASTRHAAAEALEKPANQLTLDPQAAGEGLREWLASLEPGTPHAAAFDTRVDMSPVLTGRASKGIAKQLRHHGCELTVEPESFLVTKDAHLVPDEEERARAWGHDLGLRLSAG